MRQSDKKKWVAALRSGKYKQGTNVLRDGKDKYCCLGVACHIFGVEAEARSDAKSGYQYDGNVGLLPKILRARLGLTSQGDLPKKVLLKGMKRISLVQLNDGGATFKRIAKVIERLF